MKITAVTGREIFDSRGLPTIECELVLDSGLVIIAAAPSGASTGSHEAVELRDKDSERLAGWGVQQALKVLEEQISPLLIGNIPNLLEFDERLIELQSGIHTNLLGSNTTLAVSLAVAKAQAALEGLELFELIAYLSGAQQVQIPRPWFNVINGGAHADNNVRIQEFMIVPVAAQSFREAYEDGVIFFQTLKEVLRKNNLSTAVGDEGGFAPWFRDDFQAFLMLAHTLADVDPARYCIAIDVAATQFYDTTQGRYLWHDQLMSANDLIDLYESLAAQLPLCAIEDGLAEDDWHHWTELTKRLGEQMLLVGDDLFATKTERIERGATVHAANAAVIKPNQVGTLLQTLQAILACKELGMSTIASHRSGETEDTSIADIAVGASLGIIKAGGCCRGERIAKYNRLLRIEDHLALGF